jgi:nitroreductase
MNVWDAIRKKRAVRQFRDQPLSEAEVRRILDAGRRAQSWTNDQLWNFVALRDRATLQKIAALRSNLHHVEGAALCVVLLIPSQHERTNFNYFDLGQSAAYMQLAAQALGIGSCIGTIHHPDAVRDLLQHPADWTAPVLLSFGYPQEDTARPAKVGGRRALNEVVHWEAW